MTQTDLWAQDVTSILMLITILLIGFLITRMLYRMSEKTKKVVSDKKKAEAAKAKLIKKLKKFVEVSDKEDPWGDKPYRLTRADAKYILTLIT